MAFTWVIAMGSLERIRSNILCPPGGKVYVLGEGVFSYACDKGFMCMCIRASDFRPLDSW